jgi:drug/metabolite transporter (DMT)-like permease
MKIPLTPELRRPFRIGAVTGYDRAMTLPDHSHLWPGVPLALGSAILFGVATPLAKHLLGAVDPLLLAGLLYLGAGLGLAAVHTARGVFGIQAPEAPLRTPDYPWLLAVVLFGGVAGPLLLMFGLVRTDASTGSLLLNTEGLATMTIAWLVFHESVDRRLLAGAFAIVAGAAVLAWDGHGVHFDTGALLITGACVAWGIDNNLTRKLSAADPVSIAAIKGIAAGTANTGLALLRGVSPPRGDIVAASAVTGFFCVGVSLVLFVLALRHLGTARTGAWFSIAPFVGAVAAVALLHETLTFKLIAAFLLMGFGLWMHLTERHDHEHDHDALEHEHAHRHDDHHRHVHDGPVTEPHSHWHRHTTLRHAHPHFPDTHHRHRHV